VRSRLPVIAARAVEIDPDARFGGEECSPHRERPIAGGRPGTHRPLDELIALRRQILAVDPDRNHGMERPMFTN
jgi:hypothetical protein